jgi:hypothetical protein
LPVAVLDGGGGPLDVALPDPDVQALMGRADLLADPVRGAQAILGELAMIWKEQPVPVESGIRGIVVAPPPVLPPTIWSPLLARLSQAPFLEPVPAGALAERIEPAGEPARLLDPASLSFSTSYVDRLRGLHRDIDAYASMLVEPAGEPERLRRNLLRSESLTYLGPGESSGHAWMDPVQAQTGAAFEGSTPEVQPIFTFTSQEGTIPLRMGDPGERPLRVTILLQSSQFDFPSGNEKEVVLDRPNELVEFEVQARASGQNPIAVTVRAPDGQEISSQTIVVRTTAVNAIALWITGGAGFVLLILYARRRRRIR